jgi:hypothetical protein
MIRILIACLLVLCGALPAWAGSGAGVLVLGDSNSEGPFGGTLYDALRGMRDPASGSNLNVMIFAKCGAGANDWVVREYANIDCGAWQCADGRAVSNCLHFKGGYIPPLADLYRRLGAERRVTILVLGLNMIIGKWDSKMRDAEALIDAVRANGSACIWVGPPQPGTRFVSAGTYDRFLARLKATVLANGCRYIASDDKTDRGDLGGDTKEDHYPAGEARAWARAVIDELDRPRDGGKAMREMLR